MTRHGSMNHIYRLVWSHVLKEWVAVAEKSRGRGKSARRKLAVVALAIGATGAALAGPVGGQLVSGAGSIATSGATTTINQSSKNLTLNWTSFNIGAQETVNFVQPTAAAIAVNRIFDTNGSSILGRLNANGQVYLINPNGILFGQGAQVNVGGLVASTLDLNDASVDGNARRFSGNAKGAIVNLGAINAVDGGYVALLGNHVSNQGVIAAQTGSVALGAGSDVTLNFNGNSLVGMQIAASTLNNLADNGGLIRADGGLVMMSAGARDALLASVVNNSGVIEARTVEHRAGSITLLGGMAAGSVTLSGRLDASAASGGDGGAIETSAFHVKIANPASVSTLASSGKTGTWLIDPVDFTIAASGGDISAAQLSQNLSTSDIKILSTAGTQSGNGDVNVNDAVTWGANKLTLNAQRNININAALNGSGSASLALEYGQGAVASGNAGDYIVHAPVNLAAGPNFSTKLGSDGLVKSYTVITSLGAYADATTAPSTTTLQGIAALTNLGGNFVLGSDIDAAATATPAWGNAAGFKPIGDTAARYAGSFDGLGHAVSNLFINRPATPDVGLFGFTKGATTIQNVGLIGGSVLGGAGTGALVGSNDVGLVRNSYSTASVIGGANTGGLVGDNFGGDISNSYTTGNVIGAAGTGGLQGHNTTGSISNSYATGDVSGAAGTGGLTGSLTSGSISNSYATGAVTGAAGTGGLVGTITSGTISNSYATGAVKGDAGTGGLAGTTTGEVKDAFATGAVEGAAGTGGLVGTSTGVTSNSYATGDVIGLAGTGGLMGTTTGAVSNSYANGNVKGAAGVGGLLGSSTGAVSNSYAMGDVVAISGAGGLIGAATGNVSNSYAAGKVTGAGAGGLMASSTGVLSHNFWNADAGPLNAVGAQPDISGEANKLTRAQMQVQANFTQATLANGNVNPGWDFGTKWVMNGSTTPLLRALMKTFTVTANDATKRYDGNAYFGGNGVTFSGAQMGVSNGTLSYGGSAQGAVNAGSYVITPLLTLSNQQYNVTYVGGKLTINPVVINAISLNGTRAYDGTANVAAGIFTLTGLVGGEHLTLSGVGTVADKNVGADKAVSLGSLALGNGSNGLASNYTFVGGTQKASITRLDSVTWIGGATGNWFDAANWFGGAVPDLSNVARVVIPVGVNVSFNNATATAPVQSGAVNVDSIGSQGSMALVAGELNVAKRMDLATLAQSGGKLAGSGDISLQEFSQSGGSVANGGSFTVAAKFTQSAPGTVAAGGDVAITQAIGDLSVSNVSGKNVTLTSNQNIALGAVNVVDHLTLNYGQGAVTAGNLSDYSVSMPINLPDGDKFSTKLGSDGIVKNYTVISSLGALADATAAAATLQGMAAGANLAKNYALGANVDARASSSWGNAGFTPIGTTGAVFSGNFDGLGHTITGLTINRASDAGLFGATAAGSTIRNVGLIGGSVQGVTNVGGLVGKNSASIVNSFNTGSVSGAADSNTPGAPVGSTPGGSTFVGGLLGNNDGNVVDSYATGDVSGVTSVGGLMGSNAGNVSDSYATGNVSGVTSIGGLMGSNVGNVSNAYASGNVIGTTGAGGLIGVNSAALVNNVYASGNVDALTSAGGLIGIHSGVMLSNSYASGAVTGQTFGSLIGTGSGGISDGYFKNSSTLPPTNGATGLSAADMLKKASFNFDFTNTWTINEGSSTPLLKSLMRDVTVKANDATRSYNGAAYSGGNGVTYIGAQIGVSNGTLSYSGTAQGAINAGSYVITPLLSSTNQQYRISYADGKLVLSPAVVGAISLNGTRAYDGTANVAAGIFALTGLVSGENLTLSGMGTVANKNVGIDKAVMLGSLALGNGSNGLAGNYTLSGGARTATITQAVLTASVIDQIKVFASADPLLAYGVTGLVAGDTMAQVLSGSVARVAGENAGYYGINQGALASIDPNYRLAFTPGSFHIVPRVQASAPISVPAPLAASLQLSAAPAQSVLAAALQMPDADQDGRKRRAIIAAAVAPSDAGAIFTIVDGGMRMPTGSLAH